MSISNLLKQYQELESGGLWIYYSFADRLAKLNEDTAFQKPLPEMNSAAEILGHLTHWRLHVAATLKNDQSLIAAPYNQDWPTLESLKATGWAQLHEDFKNALYLIKDFLFDQEDDFLDQTYFNTDYKSEKPYSFICEGVLQHDLYHFGQLGIVLKYIELGQ